MVLELSLLSLLSRAAGAGGEEGGFSSSAGTSESRSQLEDEGGAWDSWAAAAAAGFMTEPPGTVVAARAGMGGGGGSGVVEDVVVVTTGFSSGGSDPLLALATAAEPDIPECWEWLDCIIHPAPPRSPGDGFAEDRVPCTGLAAAGCPRFRTKLSANALEKSTSEYGGAGGATAAAAAAAGPQLSPLPADKARAAEDVEGGFELTPCVIRILR